MRNLLIYIPRSYYIIIPEKTPITTAQSDEQQQQQQQQQEQNYRLSNEQNSQKINENSGR